MRAFFAIALTGDVRQRLAARQASARALLGQEPVRWVAAETLHLTLRFLGETPASLLEQVRQAASERAAAWAAFDLQVRGMGCFPDAHRPRVIWVGASDDSGGLAAIAEDLEQIARRLGFPPEARPFSPHLTVARVRDRLSPEGGRRLVSVLEQASAEDFGRVPVRSVDLMKSQLTPSGPIYSRLAGLELGQ